MTVKVIEDALVGLLAGAMDETSGAVLSSVTDWLPDVPLLVAVSVCVAIKAYAVSALMGVPPKFSDQVPAEQATGEPVAATAFCVTVTLPSPVVHAPPMLAMSVLVKYGKVTVEPLTLVSVTTGAVLSRVNVIAVPVVWLFATSWAVASTV